jgi:dipeptidyl aminopeptidase/acylaminoacyl peptidase
MSVVSGSPGDDAMAVVRLNRGLWLAAPLLVAPLTLADTSTTPDLAAAFGARPSVSGVHLSPDGTRLSYVEPTKGQGSVAYALNLAQGGKAHAILYADGTPFRLEGCRWLSNKRLACTAFAMVKEPGYGLVPRARIIAVNADGTNTQVLSTRQNEYSRGLALGGGEIIDWSAGDDDAVLMERVYVPDDHVGSHIGNSGRGVGVDRVNTSTLEVKHVIAPDSEVDGYITDGHGVLRIMIRRKTSGGYNESVQQYLYRAKGSTAWQPLCTYDWESRTGFAPAVVDPDLDVVYGFMKKDGRMAAYTMKLDGSLHQELVYARPDVDVHGLVTIGRQERVVGVSYVTDIRHVQYLDAEFDRLRQSLAAALPRQPLVQIIDASLDGRQLLIFAGSDNDPGNYYVLDRNTHHMENFSAVRDQLEHAQLAHVRAVDYPSTDGTRIPAYLTLPPGREDAKGLPAIVIPHGGPSYRDEWGFDWLPQYFATRGYAVLQPEFRGSSGYGDDWFVKNGFQSWRVAIGDIVAGGRWLVSEGIANPARLGIVGWSYGGYAALQSATMDDNPFKAAVAVAPVTDLGMLREEHRDWGDYYIIDKFLGSGPDSHEASPLQRAGRIKVPVLLVHGTLDFNVGIEESRAMARKLNALGGNVELLEFDGLDHQLEDSAARAEMLRRADQVLSKAFNP